MESDNTFNLWHDTDLLDFLEQSDEYCGNIAENGGQMEVSVETLKEAIKQVKELDEYTVKAIKADIAWAEKKGEEYISYSCY